MHAAAGFPVKSTWLRVINKGNFETWPGLTYSNASKYCPQSVETLKGGMVQSSQRARPTKKDKHNNQKIKKVSEEEEFLPPIQTKELYIWYHPISKLYTDDCGRFPIRSRSGNEYIMIAYHCDSNTILQAPFVNRKYKHSIRAYNSIMRRLTKNGHRVDVQILDNEVSAEFRKTIVDEWNVTYKLVPPNVHRRNLLDCYH